MYALTCLLARKERWSDTLPQFLEHWVKAMSLQALVFSISAVRAIILGIERLPRHQQRDLFHDGHH
jgi:hypothetical protein